MRYSLQHRAESRRRIVTAAARAIREQGLAEVSVGHVMARAGLTHGAFYHHFADRDALLAEAVAAATAETIAHVFADDADTGSMLAAYCSPEHAANSGDGCVLAATGTEASQYGAPAVRAAFANGARGFLAHVDGVLKRPSRSARLQRSRPSAAGNATTSGNTTRPADDIDDAALALASRMLGAVILARLVDDDRLAARILAAVRQ